eukprot:3357949-Alexandrium_andersonii.AAC.1
MLRSSRLASQQDRNQPQQSLSTSAPQPLSPSACQLMHPIPQQFLAQAVPSASALAPQKLARFFQA